jgi:hypothetical protein
MQLVADVPTRGQGGKSYKVKKGDTAFSSAEEQLGKVDLVQQLLQANPNVEKFYTGQHIYLPEGEELEPFAALGEAEARAGAAAGGKNLDKLFPEAQAPVEEAEGDTAEDPVMNAEEDPVVEEAYQGLMELRAMSPGSFDQITRILGLDPAKLPPMGGPPIAAMRGQAQPISPIERQEGLGGGDKVEQRPLPPRITGAAGSQLADRSRRVRVGGSRGGRGRQTSLPSEHRAWGRG